MYRPFHEAPVANMRPRMAGPRMDPTPKNPSTVFISEVCSVVDLERSPDQRQSARFENADADSGEGKQNRKVDERISGCK